MSGLTFGPGPRPGPQEDEDSAPFWAGTRQHQLRLQRCEACAEVRFPPMPSCPACGDARYATVVVPPRGRIYSWIGVERPLGGLSEDDVPCVFAVVELESGGRLVGRLEGTTPPSMDAPVEVVFHDWDDWTEIRFRTDGAGQAAASGPAGQEGKA